MDRNLIYEQVAEVLDYWNVDYRENYVLNAIDTWYMEKQNLIELLRKHPAWNENAMAVCFNTDVNRDIDEGAYRSAFSRILNAKTCVYENNPQIIKTMYHGECNTFCSKDFERWAGNEGYDWVKEGAKMSRVINKIFISLGYDKCENYNHDFAILADAINPIKIKRHTILSTHPCDYLNMSNGNSWRSCHHLEGGKYQAGTLSFMLDKCSMIFYTLPAEYEGERYYMEGKLNRQVFAYDNNLLLQSRLYPNYNENSQSTIFRNIVQEIFATALDIPNLWTTRGCETVKEHVRTCSHSMHYPDYKHNRYDAKISYPKEYALESQEMCIGAKSFGLYDGCYHTDNSSVSYSMGENKCQCAECGAWIDEDEAWYIDGQYYCDNCTTECAQCGERILFDDSYCFDHCYYYCERCFDENFTTCEECQEIVPVDNVYYVGDLDKHVCSSCAEFLGVCQCYDCGEYHSDAIEVDGEMYCPHCAEELERKNA